MKFCRTPIIDIVSPFIACQNSSLLSSLSLSLALCLVLSHVIIIVFTFTSGSNNKPCSDCVFRVFLIMVKNVTAGDFLVLGLDLAGFHGRQANRSAKINKRGFLAYYGATPESCSRIFSDLQTTQIA
jgi:hypothetical protein